MQFAQPRIQRVIREGDASLKLWQAVLRRALADVASPDAASADAAWQWLTSAAAHVGSFVWVCAAIGVDADELRALLTREVA